jgi:cytochrome c biogenesis protein CcdA/thiol-disulfide isomerase/thioredoxin
MLELLLVGLVAGFLAGISPCILPVLPVILVGGAATGRGSAGAAGATSAGAGAGTARPGGVAMAGKAAPAGHRAAVAKPAGAKAGGTGGSAAQSRPEAPAWTGSPSRTGAGLGRPLALIAGLVVSFSLIILIGSELLSLLHLPQDTLRDIGIALLIAVGLGYLFPPLGRLLERPFSRIRSRRPSGRAGGFVLGLALGVLYIPCAGPVLAALTVVGATHHVGTTAVFLTAAFAVGTAIPLLVVAIAGSELTSRVSALRRNAPWVRAVGGAVLIIMALVIATNVLSGLQRVVPGYSTALQGSAKIRQDLSGVTGNTGAAHPSLAKCSATATTLQNCGQAPNFTDITTWLNTPGGKPLSLAGLRGKVVLVDFWTYSCINCQRTLPHIEAWSAKYAKDGLVVVGVHTPEFAFEHVVSNVRAQAADLDVHYPVAVDNNYGTWTAYNNQYWPADYLIDAQGDVRHVSFGEGGYGTTEQMIRELLIDAHPQIALPPPTDVPNKTPTGELSPETYVGYERLQYLVSSVNPVHDGPADYSFPASLPLGGMAWSGTWTDHSQEATAGPGAQIELSFLAQNVYLVLGGHGTLAVSVNGRHVQTINVAGVPRLYTLYQAGQAVTGKLLLKASPGVQAYDFTFG